METLNLEICPTNKLTKYNFKKRLLYSICSIDSHISILEGFTTCKEIILNYLAELYIDNEKKLNPKLAICICPDFEDKVKQITKVIDMFGDVNSWGKTKIYKTTHEKLYIVDLSQQWFKYPQLISIITFIMASCYEYEITKDGSIKDFIENIKERASKNSYEDTIFNPSTEWMDTIPLIMDHYDHLFEYEDPEYYYDYSKSAGGNSYMHITRSGIKSLCHYNSLSETLNEKLKYLKGER